MAARPPAPVSDASTSGASEAATQGPAHPRFAAVDIALLGVCGLVWGIAYVFIRQGIVLGASPLPFAAVRYAISAAAFAAIAASRREGVPSARAVSISAAVGGVLVIGLYGGFLYWGEQYTSGGYASILSTTAPILTVVFAYFLLPRERLGARSLAGIALGFAGVIVLVAPTLGSGAAGDWRGPLSIIGAFLCTTFGTVLLRRYGGGRQGFWQIGAQFAVAAGVLGLATAVVSGREALPSTEGVWTALAILVALSSVVGYFTYFALHHRIGPVRANTVTYLIPLVGVGVGSGFYGEPITLWEIGGFLIVLVGLTLIVRESAHSAH